jgi:glucosamine 6-phosphate synthetase-like amidotransferase/phosphosugar isomerase protein
MRATTINFRQSQKYKQGHTAVTFCGVIDNQDELSKALTEAGVEIDFKRPAQLVYALVEYVKVSQLKRTKNAVKMAIEILEGQYSFVYETNDWSKKQYCVNRGLNVYVGLSANDFIISNEITTVLSHTERMISLEDGMMVEIFDDGTCQFTDGESQRLNMEYRSVIKKESTNPENHIFNILRKELHGVVPNVFGSKDLLLDQLNLS